MAYVNMKKRVLSQAKTYIEKRKGTIYEKINIQEDWLGEKGFENFYKDIGPAPTTHKAILDRIDNSLGYFKENVSWATVSESNLNKGNARMLTYLGKTQNLEKWAKELSITSRTLKNRLDSCGWSLEKALTTELLKGRSFITAFEKTLYLEEWSKETGIPSSVISVRINSLV